MMSNNLPTIHALWIGENLEQFLDVAYTLL
ncbi:hypothetical protein BANRA_01444 [Acinetobacter baumannii]|nr:hypothetical protein BANRA_01444 [Acinetobacter baumannii]